jgi:hypothetical protein
VTRRWSRPARAAAVALVAAAIAVPVAWAAHTFTDVPDASPFHEDVTAVKDAAITGGKTCTPPGTPPTYCPEEPIARQGMAAFLHRGFGRVGQGIGAETTLATNPSTLTPLALMAIRVGGTTGGTQFVKIEAAITSRIESETGCPCTARFFIDRGMLPEILVATDVTHGEVDAAAGGGYRSTRLSTIVAVPSGTSPSVRVVGNYPNGTGTIKATAVVTATTVPFEGASGG